MKGRYLSLILVGSFLVAETFGEGTPAFVAVHADTALDRQSRDALRVRLAGTPVASAVTEPTPNPRQLAIVVDPDPRHRGDVRRHTLELVAALANLSQNLPVRLVFPLGAGFATPPVTDRKELPAETERAFDRYLPETTGEAPESTLTLDLAAAILGRLDEEGGPLDALLVFKDGEFDSHDADYLAEGTSRLLGSVMTRHGSSLHCYTGDTGVLGRACDRLGGRRFDWTTGAAEVASTLVEESRTVTVLRINLDEVAAGAAMDLEVLSDSGRRLRAARTLWRHPESRSVPNHYSMREGLAWLRRSLEAESAGNMTNTLLNAEAALRHDPWNWAACAAAGRSLRETGEWDRAFHSFRLALALGATDESTVEGFSVTCRRAGMAARGLRTLEPLIAEGRQPIPKAALERARLQAAAGQLHAACQSYAALAAEPNADETAIAEYGEVLRSLGRIKDAETQFSRALSLNSRNVHAIGFLAERAALTGDRDSAVQLSQKAVEIEPQSGVIQTMLGRLAEARGDWPVAVSRYSDAIRKEGPGADLEFLLTRAMIRAGHAADAVRFLRSRVEADPEDAGSWRQLSELLVATGSVGEAAAVLESGATSLDGDGSQLYREAAGLRERLGESGQALLDYRSMLRSSADEDGPTAPSSVRAHMAALDLMSAGLDDASQPPSPPTTPPAQGTDGAAGPAGKEPQPVEDGLEIPGGVDPFARAVGIEPSILRLPDGLERCLFFVMGSPQRKGGKSRQNEVAADIVEYIRNYTELLKHLRKKNLIPAGFDGTGEQVLAFPLVGPPDTLKRTASFLRFFGIKLSLKKNRDRSTTIEVVLGQSSRNMARQQFLRLLGVNVTDPQLREYRVTVGSSRIPMLAGAHRWSEFLLNGTRKPKSPYLLERLISDQRAIRLYLALARCSPATRQGLIASAPRDGLLPLADQLYSYGYALDFREGRLQWPGDVAAWSELLRLQPTADPGSLLEALLSRDGGGAMAFYAALASAPKAVQDFLAVTGRLGRVYEAATVNGSPSALTSSQIAPFSIGRLLRGLKGDPRGLVVPASDSLRGYYNWPKASSEGAGDPSGLIGEAALSELMRSDRRGGRGSPQLTSLEFLSYLSSALPGALTPETLDAFLKDPTRTPAMLDIVWDLAPPAELLGTYLKFCNSLIAEDVPKWNENRVRTAQSLVHLLALLRRQGAIDEAGGRRLLSSALESMSPEVESEFARSVAIFLSRQLMPAIRNSRACPEGQDVVLCALAGDSRPLPVNFEGRSFQLDLSAWKLQRMMAAIQHQDYSTLQSVLAAYTRLIETKPEGGREVADAVTSALAMLRNEGRVAAGTDTDGKGDNGRAGLAALSRRAQSLAAGSGGSGAATLLSEAAAAMHVELGVSLLAYSYAFHGAPEVDVMAFDPQFVRKHDFGSRERLWLSATRTNSGSAGLRCTGSISGLGVELGGLETAQLNQDFGSREGRDLIPSMLSGMRAVDARLRTDRAQEFVALTVRLGREILAAACFDKPTDQWIRTYIEERLPPRRRTEILDLIGEKLPVPAASMLSPSELFLLGDRYRDDVDPVPFASQPPEVTGHGLGTGDGISSQKDVPSLLSNSPHLERLRQLTAFADENEAWAFRRELNQYGILLRSRLGLSRLSLHISDPFEALESEFPDRLLFDRMCDLKIRLAELNYSLGLPAALGEVEGELALREILPRTNVVRSDSWRLVLDRISLLGAENVRDWIDELLNRGALSSVAQAEAVEGGTLP